MEETNSKLEAMQSHHVEDEAMGSPRQDYWRKRIYSQTCWKLLQPAASLNFSSFVVRALLIVDSQLRHKHQLQYHGLLYFSYPLTCLLRI